jgi:Spy/CpxP family protein refolding chaperone
LQSDKKILAMKKLILVLSSLFLVFAVNAQEVKSDKKGGDSKKKMEQQAKLMTDLGLTEEQKTQFIDLQKRQKEEMAKFNSQDTTTVPNFSEEKSKLVKSQQKELIRILTTEQKDKWKEIKAAQKKAKEDKE